MTLMKLARIAVLILVPFLTSLAGTTSGDPQEPKVMLELPVTSNDVLAGRAQNSPVIAGDPTEPRFLALANRVDAPDYGCGLHVSSDGGRLWAPVTPVRELPQGADKCYAPQVAFDGEGTLYYLFVGLQGTGNEPLGVFLSTSSDKARTFSRPRRVLGPFNFQVRMAIDSTNDGPDRLHLVWLHASSDPSLAALPTTPNPILTAHSDDGGHTFSDPVQVNDPARELVVAPTLVLGSERIAHVVFYDLQDDVRDYRGLEGPAWEGNWSVVSATSYDGGDTFEPNVVVDDDILPPERVQLIFTMPPPTAVADAEGRVFAAWHDGRNGDWDVFLSRSDDEGRTWAPPVRINDDAERNGANQYLPRLAVAPDGRLEAIFYDRRNDPRNLRNDVYYTFSVNGGQSFAPNLKLTRESSDSRIGYTYPLLPWTKKLVEFGAGLALLSREGDSIAAWTDTRNALAPPYQDIFATKISFPADQSPSRMWVPGTALAITALLALLLTTAALRRSGSQETDPVEPPH